MGILKEDEKKILDTFEKVIPSLSRLEKERLLSFGEGIAFKTERLRNPIDKKAG